LKEDLCGGPRVELTEESVHTRFTESSEKLTELDELLHVGVRILVNAGFCTSIDAEDIAQSCGMADLLSVS